MKKLIIQKKYGNIIGKMLNIRRPNVNEKQIYKKILHLRKNVLLLKSFSLNQLAKCNTNIH